MSKAILDDEFWMTIEPLLPPPTPQRFGHPGTQTDLASAGVDRHPRRAADGASRG